ncbi:MAG: hypothetical protein ABEI52_04420 [Halobacteriaceae archaeon]
MWTSLRSRERPTVGFQVEKHEPATGESHRDITVLMRSPEDGEINGAFKIETT